MTRDQQTEARVAALEVRMDMLDGRVQSILSEQRETLKRLVEIHDDLNKHALQDAKRLNMLLLSVIGSAVMFLATKIDIGGVFTP